MKNSLRIHKWTHNEFNIFILGVLTRPQDFFVSDSGKGMDISLHPRLYLLNHIIKRKTLANYC